MRPRPLLTLLFALLMIPATAFSQSGKTYGSKLTLKEPTLVSAILANPKAYVGKVVQVKGIIVDVCSKRGCWMEISGDKPYTKLRVKVEDGEIVFPVSAKGQEAVVEGELTEIRLTPEQALARAKHQAEEYGKPFDPAAVKDTVIYQLKGLGAVVR